ncbi:hypothetical protein C7271_12215 [filamentous cyanobacterium CCP5]|nr:hypothetical protein C7271_12215 [filamentous cyanobacterium CCP5]
MGEGLIGSQTPPSMTFSPESGAEKIATQASLGWFPAFAVTGKFYRPILPCLPPRRLFCPA